MRTKARPGLGFALGFAFTLVELMVVVAIIAILISLLAPALDSAIDAAVKARCGSQQHSLIAIFTQYAMNSQRKYPNGLRDYRTANGTAAQGMLDDFEEHIPYLGARYVAMVTEYAGNSNKANTYVGYPGYTYGGLPLILVDPTYPRDFGLTDAYGSWIGYNYLAGHPYVSKANGRADYPQYSDFESPISMTKAGTGEMWACHNTWEVGGRLANVAHTRPGGPAGGARGGECFNWDNGGKDPVRFESAGGNLGRVDGSVGWKDLKQMETYASGADKNGTPYTGWPAMW